MKELSLHILDIANNSVKAGAKNITVEISEAVRADTLTITITDDGCGMSEEMLRRVRDPFTTTRTTRKVGMGISLFEAAAVQTGGGLDISSEVGKGTVVTAVFKRSSIDLAPIGCIWDTLTTLIGSTPDIHYVYIHRVEEREFILDTEQIKQLLGGVSLALPEVIVWISEYIKENVVNLYN